MNMQRTVTDIRENLDFAGCDNETAREMCDEIERLQTIVQMARKATQPGVAASARHPYYLELVQDLWKGE